MCRKQAYKAAGGTIRLGNTELLKLLDNFADDIAADVAAETLAAQLGRTRTMEAIESVLDKTTFEAIKDIIEGRGLEQAELEKLNQVIRGYSLQKGEQMSTTQIRGLLKDGSYLTKSVDDVVAGLVKGSERVNILTNLGNNIDITPSRNHTTLVNNPGPKGMPDSSIDILDKDGNIVTRRWYDSKGRAYRDVDMTNHGNPKEHPEVPHEHTWEYKNGKFKRN